MEASESIGKNYKFESHDFIFEHNYGIVKVLKKSEKDLVKMNLVYCKDN